MKMKLFSSPRLLVTVMALALTVLSIAQERGAPEAIRTPLFLAKISLFPDNCANPTGNKTVTLFAGGGLQGYTYTISSSVTTPATQTQTGLLVGTPATFTYAGTGTGDITYTITDNAGTMVTGSFDVEEGRFTSGQGQVDICFSPNTVNVSSTLPGTATLNGSQPCTSLDSPGGCTFSTLTPGNVYEVDITLVSPDCTYPTSTLKFQMPQITPLSFFAGAYTCQSILIKATGGSGYYRLFGASQSPIAFSNIAAVNFLPVGTYTLGLQDAISTACTPQPPSQQLTIYNQPTFVSGYPQVTATSCGANNGTITVAVTGGSGSYRGFAYGDVHGLYDFPNFGNGSSSITQLPPDTYNIAITDTANCSASNQTVTVKQGSSLGLSATPTASACSGGAGALQYVVTESNASAVTAVTVTETTSGYSTTFVNPMAFPLIGIITSPAFTAGATYNLTATDIQPGSTVNCSQQIIGAIPASPTQVLISVTNVTSPTCSGGSNGSIALSVSGGTAPYTATLSGGTAVPPITNFPGGMTETFTGLAASMYVITVTDANGCVVNSGSITLSAVDQINITASPTSPTCFGGTNGSIMFTVTNAIPNSTVVLKNSSGSIVKTITNVPNGVHETISSLAAGLYSLTTSDANGCSSTTPVNIQPGANVMINALSVSPILCNGGKATISFTVSGGTAPYRSCLFQGNQQFSSCILCNGACNAVQTFTGVPAGNYSLRVTDAKGCSSSVAVTVTQPQPVNFTIHTSSNSCPRNQSVLRVNATGGTAPYRYQLDGGAFHQDGSSYSFGCVKKGKHTVTVKDANGCMKTAQIYV